LSLIKLAKNVIPDLLAFLSFKVFIVYSISNEYVL